MHHPTNEENIAALERWMAENQGERETASEERRQEIDVFVEYLRAWIARLAAKREP